MSEQVWTISPVDRIRHIKSFGPVGGLPLDEVSILAQHSKEYIFRAGEEIAGPGRRDASPFVIVSGKVRVRADWILKELHGPGEEVGFLASLTDRWEHLEAIAETEVVALGMTPDVLMDVFEDRFPILIDAIRTMSRQALEARKQIEDGTYLAIPSRMSAVPDDAEEISLVDVIVSMRKAALFADGGMNALIRMAQGMERVNIQAGDRLWNEGDPSGTMVTVVRGEFDCHISDGRSFSVGPGYPMGALESNARHPRWYSAVAKTEIAAFRSRISYFYDVLEDHPEIAIQFLAQTAENVVRLQTEAKKAQFALELDASA